MIRKSILTSVILICVWELATMSNYYMDKFPGFLSAGISLVLAVAAWRAIFKSVKDADIETN